MTERLCDRCANGLWKSTEAFAKHRQEEEEAAAKCGCTLCKAEVARCSRCYYSLGNGPVHQQALVTVGSNRAEVDAGIAPLIHELWTADIDTTMSCQSNPAGKVWIAMDVHDCERFLSIAAGRRNDDEGSLYDRIVNCMAYEPEDSWEYYLEFDDINNMGPVGLEAPPVSAVLFGTVDVRFPHRDYPRVLNRFRAFNKRGRSDKDDSSDASPATLQSTRTAAPAAELFAGK
jgi:hypothetical protein